MESIDANGNKVYNLSAGRLFPNWLTESQKKKLAKDEDFQMNSACERVKLSQDGKFIVVTGVYPPIIRTFEVQEKSMKFERHLTSEVVQFQLLSNDYSKIALLEEDRNIELHAAYGYHYKTRIPKMGRDMTYFKENCELLIVGSTPEIYRLSLEQGVFLKSFETNSSGNNAIGISPIHQLIGVCGDNGVLECWDERQRNRITSLNVSDNELTTLRFSNDGMNVAIGSSKGLLYMYDLRMSEPLYTKQYQYETPIMDLKFTNNEKLIGCDQKVIKFWNYKTQEHMCTIETPNQINDLAIVPNTGLFFVACEQERMISYYMPSLGPAPKWCSYIDSITEELEEEESSTYVDYKFITREEIEKMGLTHLIGSNLLRSYMHGYFMDYKLYNKLVTISDPDAYDRWKKEEIIRREEKKKEQRIIVKHKLPKVNKDLAKKLLDEKKSKTIENPLEDDRFADMFKRDEFSIDQNSDEYKRLRMMDHMKSNNKRNNNRSNDDDDDDNDEIDEKEILKDQFELLDEIEEEQQQDIIKNKRSDDDNDFNSDDFNSDDDDDDDSESEEENTEQQKKQKLKEKQKSKQEKRKLYKLKEGESTILTSVNKKENNLQIMKQKEIQNKPLEERVNELKNDKSSSRLVNGKREITFEIDNTQYWDLADLVGFINFFSTLSFCLEYKILAQQTTSMYSLAASLLGGGMSLSFVLGECPGFFLKNEPFISGLLAWLLVFATPYDIGYKIANSVYVAPLCSIGVYLNWTHGISTNGIDKIMKFGVPYSNSLVLLIFSGVVASSGGGILTKWLRLHDGNTKSINGLPPDLKTPSLRVQTNLIGTVMYYSIVYLFQSTFLSFSKNTAKTIVFLFVAMMDIIERLYHIDFIPNLHYTAFRLFGIPYHVCSKVDTDHKEL